MKHLWRTMLRLYPAAFREQFGAEMETVFDLAAAEHRRLGRLDYAAFLIGELVGLAIGSASAWATTARPVIVVAGSASMQTLIERNLRLMEHAIATHQFEKARFYARVDDELRARLPEPPHCHPPQ